MNNLEDLKYDMANRVIYNPVFTNFDKSLKLNDIVILYNDGMHWKAIPQKIMLSYPVIHDKYEDNKVITIYSCPFTLFSCVYFGEYMPGNSVYNNNLTLNNKDILIIPILGNVYNKDSMTIMETFIRKGEVKIMSLRNAISMFPDILFINTESINKKESLIDSDYMKDKIVKYSHADYSDKFHPKQIIYVIEYYSKKKNGYKYTAIIPKNNILDIAKNKFLQYFNKMIDKIRDKGGHIYSCYWFAWDATHNNFKTIEI